MIIIRQNREKKRNECYFTIKTNECDRYFEVVEVVEYNVSVLVLITTKSYLLFVKWHF